MRALKFGTETESLPFQVKGAERLKALFPSSVRAFGTDNKNHIFQSQTVTTVRLLYNQSADVRREFTQNGFIYKQVPVTEPTNGETATRRVQ